MPRDTKRIEKLLAQTKANRQLVRDEINDGASLQHVYDELGSHEHTFSTRLKDLQEFNKRETAAASKTEPAKTEADEEAAKEESLERENPARAKLFKKTIEELKKIAAESNAEINIQANTKKAQIVDAILAAQSKTQQ